MADLHKMAKIGAEGVKLLMSDSTNALSEGFSKSESTVDDALSDIVNGYVKNVGFVALCTPILAYAGVSIGKDLDDFAKTGWRIVILAIVVFVGTYIASAIIAQCILKALGQI